MMTLVNMCAMMGPITRLGGRPTVGAQGQVSWCSSYNVEPRVIGQYNIVLWPSTFTSSFLLQGFFNRRCGHPVRHWVGGFQNVFWCSNIFPCLSNVLDPELFVDQTFFYFGAHLSGHPARHWVGGFQNGRRKPWDR